MCGIAGILGELGYEPQRRVLEEMSALLHHRGPDDEGIFIHQNLGFAHRRLSLLDLSSAGHQPWVEQDHVLVYNGEIYNFARLRKDLENRGLSFTSGSDTEVLFRSLVTDGIEATVSRIEGMFAFAFADLRSGVSWLCRDRFGIKPLLYRSVGGRVAFASEAKALRPCGGLELDPIVALFSVTGMADHSATRTPFVGISQVAPGHYLEVADGQVRNEVSYYRPSDQVDEAWYREMEGWSWDEVVAEADRRLSTSVASMLVADAPVGAFVSGGVDSSLITALTDGQTTGDFTLFTADVIGQHSERAAADRLAQHVGRPLVATAFEPTDLVEQWATCTWHYETPLVKHSNAAPFARIAATAHESGVKAVLTGEGSDELFLGYPPLLFDRYRPLVEAPLKAVDRLYRLSPRLADQVLGARKQTTAAFIDRLAQRFEREQLLVPNDGALSFLPPKERTTALHSFGMLQEHLLSLLHRNDRMGMSASIESRFPFLDEEFVRFGLNLPIKFKIARSMRAHNVKHPFLVDKAVIRRLAAQRLPADLAQRPKDGFPMYGLRNVRVASGSFRGGYVAELLSLDGPTQDHLITHGDPYEVAKLFSVEVFGRLFALDHSIPEVTEWVKRHADVVT